MPTEIASPISSATTDITPDHPESTRPGRQWLRTARFIACLLLLLFFAFRGPGPVMLPLLTLFLAAVVGPKGSFQRLWRIVLWACAAGAVISFLLVIVNLPAFIHGNVLDWIAAGLVMLLIPKLFGWSEEGGGNRLSRALAWIFGVLAGFNVQLFIGLKEAERWLSNTPPSEQGIWGEASPSVSAESLLVRFIIFCGAAFIAYRFAWLQKQMFGYLGRKIKEQ